MADDGETKDDVKKPEGEIGDKIEKLFRTEEKDTSKSGPAFAPMTSNLLSQMSLFSPPWESRLPLKLRRPLPKVDRLKPFWNDGAGKSSVAVC